MIRTIQIHVQVEADTMRDAQMMGVAIMDHLEDTFNDDDSLLNMWVETERRAAR